MKNKILILSGLCLLGTLSCTKLDQKLQSSIPATSGNSAAAGALLNGTYNDFADAIHGVGGFLNLQCNT